MRGNKVDIRNTTDAIARGIETIYQDSALVTQLSIARNLFLGREPVKGRVFLDRLDQTAMNEVARDLPSGSVSRKKFRQPPDQCVVWWRTASGRHCPGDAFRQRPDYP